jgi:pyruvate/2-oxoacid:ferredoxin oxidoreductase alpha subunit
MSKITSQVNDYSSSIDRFAIRFGGAAGDGLQSTGRLLQKYFNRLSYYVQGFPGTQSTIRGGHVWQHVEFSHSLSGNRCGLPESWSIHEKMIEKRFKKLELLREEMLGPELHGPENADHTILCWGSTQGAVIEAVEILNQTSTETWNALSFVDLHPLPYNKIKPYIEKIQHSIIIEVNYPGQFEKLLHEHLDWKPNDVIHPLSGETPTHDSIIKDLNKVLERRNS